MGGNRPCTLMPSGSFVAKWSFAPPAVFASAAKVSSEPKLDIRLTDQALRFLSGARPAIVIWGGRRSGSSWLVLLAKADDNRSCWGNYAFQRH